MTIHNTFSLIENNVRPFGRLAHKVVERVLPKGHGLALVVPCYNEAKRLDGDAFIEFLEEHSEVRVIFVNDGSKDNTLDILSALHARMPEQIDVVTLTQNSGKAEAVRQGLIHASMTGIELMGYWDADLATPLDAVIDFVRVAERAAHIDVIFGSRRMMLGHKIERTLSRRLVSRLCAQLARLALRLPIGDTQCGAKLLRNTKPVRRALAEPFTAGWLFDVELFSRIAQASANHKHAFYELPLMEWNEIAGSKVSGRAIIKAGFKMLGLIAETRLGLKIAKTDAPEAATAEVVRSVYIEAPVEKPNSSKAA